MDDFVALINQTRLTSVLLKTHFSFITIMGQMLEFLGMLDVQASSNLLVDCQMLSWLAGIEKVDTREL